MTIYLDNAATTRVCPEAVSAAVSAMTEDYGNPSSLHYLGTQAAVGLKANRAAVADALGCLPEEVFFTSGGTEGDNWAIAIAAALGKRTGRHIITTAVEHAAVLESLHALERQDYEVTYLAPNRDGQISLSELESSLRPDTVLASIMLVNNETGAVEPVAEAAKLIKRLNPHTLFHTDAVQGFLKIPFTPEELGVDLLTVSGHKIGGLKGSGALFIRKGLNAVPLLWGGGQESGLRSGTEATPQIAAFAAACRVGKQKLEEHQKYLSGLKHYAVNTLAKTVPGLTIVSGEGAPHICAISLPGYPSQMLVRDLSDHGICVSSGSACHKGKPSHVFAAMHLPPQVQMGILRISFSPDNTEADINALAEALLSITQQRVPSGKLSYSR